MKSNIVSKEEKKIKIPFPKLMYNYDTKEVVLFSSERKGTVLYPGETSSPIGLYIDYWNMQSFIDFEDTVIISN